MPGGVGGACFTNGIAVNCSGDWLPLVLIPLLLACLGVAVIAAILISAKRSVLAPLSVPARASQVQYGNWKQWLAIAALFLVSMVVWLVTESLTFYSQARAFRLIPSWALVETLLVLFVLLAAIFGAWLVGYLITGRNVLPGSRAATLRSRLLTMSVYPILLILMAVYGALVLPALPQLWWLPFAAINLGVLATFIWLGRGLAQNLRRH